MKVFVFLLYENIRSYPAQLKPHRKYAVLKSAVDDNWHCIWVNHNGYLTDKDKYRRIHLK